MEAERAVAFYQKHLERVKKYNQDHKEDLSKKSREYFQKIKADPAKYQDYKDKKKERYRELNPKPVLPVKEFA